MNTYLKYFLIILFSITLLLVGYNAVNYWFETTAEGSISMQDAVENYNLRAKEIKELADYFISKVPDPETGKGVLFGFGSNHNKFDIGIYLLDGSVDENNPNHGGSNLKLNSAKMDSLLAELNWSNDVIKTLKKKLEKTNCLNISIDQGHRIALNFKYSGWGLYSYYIFYNPLSDSEIKMYTEKFHDVVIGKNVVVMYTTSI